jgi:hypothetical protein
LNDKVKTGWRGCAILRWTFHWANGKELCFSRGTRGQATLNGWSLGIAGVPEPANMAMVGFGVGFIGFVVLRNYRGSRKAALQPSSPAA